jgi:chemotaxis protein MotB
MVNPEAPRRIVKKARQHGGHHGGAWKVAYADFVTAMMALFIVLWIVGQSKSVKEAVAAYFKDPSVFSSGAPGLLKGGEAALAPKGPSAGPPPPAEPAGGGGRDADRAKLESMANELRQQIHGQVSLAALEDKVKIELADEGLRISLVETNQGVFFDVGSARVKPATQEILGIIAREVGKLPNEIILEGHTDSRPYVGAPSYSNWELSTDRANAARRILSASGIRPQQVASVAGYADRHLSNQTDPLDAANRRITINVLFQKERIGAPARSIQPALATPPTPAARAP